MQKVYNELTEDGYAPRTVRYVHSILKSALSQAVKRQIISLNPCDIIDLPRQKRNEMKAFSPTEATRFLEAAKSDKHGIIYSFALISGMRPEEYLALKWKDIDFEKNSATVQRTLIWRKGGGWYFGEPKTTKSRRTLPMPENSFSELKNHQKNQKETKLKFGSLYQENDLVFATDTGKPLHHGNLRQRHFQPILERADLKGFRPYDLRHSMATLLLSKGLNPKIVSERLGHASIALTLDIYSHVLPDMQKEASEKLGMLLFG